MKKVLEDKRNVVVLIISAICLVACIAGIAYAYIAYYARQKEVNVIGTDCIKIEMKELTNAITLEGAHPISDEAGNNTKPFIFEITNTCGVGVHYNVNLEVLTIKEGEPIENLIESKNIATKIDKGEVKTLTSEIETTPTYDEADYKATESYTMYSGVLNPGETKSHEVRIWLHYSAGNETQNKNFYSKVVIEGIQNEVASINFSEYIMNKNEESIEKIEHEATEQTPSLTDYRYTGANPNNYVYFGCSDNCTEDNLYRIIGVIPTQSSDTSSYKNRVKLIKASNYEGTTGILSGSQYTKSGKGYRWNTNNSNAWESSSLKEILNGEYYNSLGEYQKYIEQAKWYLGAPNHSSYTTYTTEQFYTLERSNKKGESEGLTSYVDNIGLMYPSDYGYSLDGGVNGETWTSQALYNNRESYQYNAWMHTLSGGNYYEWMITPETISSDSNGVYVWSINSNGFLYCSSVFFESNILGVRPTFYLKEDIIYIGGTGSEADPYRIGTEEKKFSDYIIGERNNDASIVQVVHEETEQTGLNASIDYRYTGKNPNNYVCFGSEVSPCPNDNLYRIIGVIPTQSSENGQYENRVKLIKANYYTENESGLLLTSNGTYPPSGETGKGYQWNDSNNNKWEESTLQRKVLNEVYWNSLGEYQNYIEQTKWYLGAPSYLNHETYNADQFFNAERSNTQGYSKGAISFIGNIGLVYPSDYSYSIESSYQGISSYHNGGKYISNAWLYNEGNEWTMSSENGDSGYVFAWFLSNGGAVGGRGAYHPDFIWGIRPTFYLKNAVHYKSGDGSIGNPYRLKV